MLRLLSALLGLIAFIAIAAVGVLLLVVEPRPLVTANATLAPAELRSFAALVKASDLEHPGIKRLTLTPTKLNAMADLGAGRLGGHARVRLGRGDAALVGSFPLGGSLGYANLHVELRETAGVPAVAAARLGSLPLPAPLVNELLRLALDKVAPAAELLRVSFEPDQVRALYRLRGDAKSAALALLDDPERRRLGVREAQLAAIVAGQPGAGALSLTPLLAGLLAQPTGVVGAAGRPDAVADNSAALLVLAVYVNGRRLPLAGSATPALHQVVLRGRHDLAQHFTVSAVTAAEGGSRLAQMVGLAKELSDADGGSGFSFVDMLANRAGIRLAELATGSAAGGDYVRRMARAGLTEADIMPDPSGLPEGMQEAVLERTIGTPSSAAYARLTEHIDRRIQATRLHRGMPSG